jgi:hypothetical protein
MINKIECFKIQIFKLTNQKNIKEIDSYETLYIGQNESLGFKKNPIIIVADPFLFVHEGKLFLFYELKTLYGKGVIMMTHTDDLENWTEPCCVLDEEFHLSYPYVFEYDNSIYMIPETCADRSVRLYKADNNELTSFSFTRKLVEEPKGANYRISYSDSSIYKKSDKYYLQTTVNIEGINHLKMYVSNSLDGLYTEHSASPLVINNRYGRNGGCLFEYKGNLYRPAQECEKRYGDNVHLMKVTTLNEVEYREEPICHNIINTGLEFYSEGGHQFNFVAYDGNIIIATDAKEYRYYLFRRIINKMKRICWR